MPAKALLLGLVLLTTGCASLHAPSGRAGPLIARPLAAAPGLAENGHLPPTSSPAYTATGEEARSRHRRPVRLPSTTVLSFSAEERTRRAVELGLLDVDTFEALLARAGLEDRDTLPPRDAPLTPEDAARLLGRLGQRPVTRGSFPPRMAAGHLLREVLEGGAAPRGELLRRVERFTGGARVVADGRRRAGAGAHRGAGGPSGGGAGGGPGAVVILHRTHTAAQTPPLRRPGKMGTGAGIHESPCPRLPGADYRALRR